MPIKYIDSYFDKFRFIPIVCGPTASGKSSLALELCRKVDGELISADSMQIYKHLDVGTAKATKEEQEEIPHHLIDIIEPGVDFSVNDFLEHCFKAIESCLNRGKLPVICGGTGQYVSALRDGIRYMEEPVPDEVVNNIYKRIEDEGIETVYNQLSNIDPQAVTQIHINNTRRVVRALAVYEATGKTFTEWNKLSKTTGPSYPFKLFNLDYEDARDVLYDRINKRVDIMMEENLLEEAEYLYSLDINRKSTCFQAIGYKEFAPYFSGEIPLEKAIYDIKLNSRHYAKRQLTWFRYIDDIIRLNRENSNAANVEEIINHLYI